MERSFFTSLRYKKAGRQDEIDGSWNRADVWGVFFRRTKSVAGLRRWAEFVVKGHHRQVREERNKGEGLWDKVSREVWSIFEIPSGIYLSLLI